MEALNSGGERQTALLADSGDPWPRRGSGSGGVSTVISNRHRRKDTFQLQAEVARLNGGHRATGRTTRPCGTGTRVAGRKRSGGITRVPEGKAEAIRKKIAAGGETDGAITQEAAAGDPESPEPAGE